MEEEDGGASSVVARVRLEENKMHPKLEGAPSREKRERDAARLRKQAPPVHPPEEYNLRRRRGGLGEISWDQG